MLIIDTYRNISYEYISIIVKDTTLAKKLYYS